MGCAKDSLSPGRGGWMRLFKSKPKEHHAAVYDTRPKPGDTRNNFEPYFIAICDCDWSGDARKSSEEAFHDAHAHTPNVDDYLKRPVG
jgi:hypothetical protein